MWDKRYYTWKLWFFLLTLSQVCLMVSLSAVLPGLERIRISSDTEGPVNSGRS